MELSEEEIKKLRALIADGNVLHRIAKKEEAWTLVLSSVKTISVGLAAILAAFLLIGDWLKAFLKGIG